MIWTFKIIGKILFYTFGVVFALAFLPLYLPFYIIKKRKRKKSGLKSVRFTATPKFSSSMSGQDYEVYCAKRLGREGYRNLAITPSRGDFGADIIGYDRKGKKVCFQCKMYKRSVGVSAVQEVLAAKQYYGADKSVVITTSIFTPAARKLAKSGEVRLIEHYYEKDMDDLSWIDSVERYNAAID